MPLANAQALRSFREAALRAFGPQLSRRQHVVHSPRGAHGAVQACPEEPDPGVASPGCSGSGGGRGGGSRRRMPDGIVPQPSHIGGASGSGCSGGDHASGAEDGECCMDSLRPLAESPPSLAKYYMWRQTANVIYIAVHVCTGACMRGCMCVHARVHVCACACMDGCMCAHVHAWAGACVHRWVCGQGKMAYECDSL
eukprot:349634-Chlamydomonas_euryale.AAC.1